MIFATVRFTDRRIPEGDIRGVVERDKAAIGVLLSMESPTRPMREEAADAGS